jgi:iron complex outermembrane receptor protein
MHASNRYFMTLRRLRTASHRKAWHSIVIVMILAPCSHLRAAAEVDMSSLDEVVVTATKRVENLEDVPISISVLNSDTLQKSGAQSFEDYLPAVPSTSYVTQGNGRDRINIRGVSSLPGDLGQSTTGIYLDEAPVGEVTGGLANLDLFDLDRVEVLRGPQGTLFGAGSMGGAIRLILAKPKLDEFSGTASLTGSETAHGGGNYDLHAVLNAPLIDQTLAMRLMVGDRRDSGFIDDPFTRHENVNSHRQESGRFELLAKPTTDLSVLLTAIFQRDTTGGNPFADIGAGPYEQTRYYPEASEYETRLVGLTVNDDFEWANFTSATNFLGKSSYFGQDVTSALGALAEVVTDAPLAPGAGIGLANGGFNHVFSQEFRLASADRGRIRWVVGAFYSHQHVVQTQVFDTSFASQFAGFPALYSGTSDFTYEQIAGFGEVNFLLTDDWTFTAGVRSAHFKNTDTETSDGLLGAGGAPQTYEDTENKTTPKFSLQYAINPEDMVYATASQGYRIGGPNPPVPVSECAADLAALGLAEAPGQYKPDSIWNYEVGSKNRLLDNRLTVNGAVYYIDWKNIQVSENLNCGFDFGANAGSANSKGAELEIAAKPMKGLSLTASGSLTNAQFTATLPDVGIVSGTRVPGVSRYTYDLAAEYAVEAYGGSNFFHADYQGIGPMLNGFLTVSTTRRIPAYELLNLRVGHSQGPWDVELFAKNVLDRRAVIYIRANSTANYSELAQPQTIGINIQRHF